MGVGSSGQSVLTAEYIASMGRGPRQAANQGRPSLGGVSESLVKELAARIEQYGQASLLC